MSVIEEHPIRRFREGEFASVSDAVADERRIELNVNDGELVLAMLCLPRDLEALAVGFLLGEGVLRRREDLDSVAADVDGGTVRIRGDFDAVALENIQRRWTWGTGCGGGGTGRDLDSSVYAPVTGRVTVAPGRLLELSSRFQSASKLWRKTGGVHSCALAGIEAIRLYAEDIGRHNAFDKIMGRALLEGVQTSDKLVLTTGRLSAEIVSKAVACRVPILASRSAVTSLGIAVARRFGLTLVGFVRGKRLSVYTGYERVSGRPSE